MSIEHLIPLSQMLHVVLGSGSSLDCPLNKSCEVKEVA